MIRLPAIITNVLSKKSPNISATKYCVKNISNSAITPTPYFFQNLSSFQYSVLALALSMKSAFGSSSIINFLRIEVF